MRSSNKNSSNAPEITTPNQLKRMVSYGKMAGAVVLSSVVAGQAAEAAGAKVLPRPVRANTVERYKPKQLKTVEQLPGFYIKANPEKMRHEQQAATVQILSRPNNSPTANWSQSCTGVRVRLPVTAMPYVMTAGHCFSDATTSTTGVFINPLSPNDKAENYSTRSSYQYSVANPSKTPRNTVWSPLNWVGGISINTNKKDLALLNIIPPSPGHSQSDVNQPPANYGDIPAIPAYKFFRKPIPGERVLLYGMSAADGDVPLSSTGRYIGEVTITDYIDANKDIGSRKVYIVGVNPKNPKADPGNFGDSGSVAGFELSGSYSGPMTMRINLGYPNGVWQKRDRVSQVNDKKTIQIIENQTGVDVGKEFGTIIGFTPIVKNDFPKMVAGLNVLAPNLG